MQNSRSPPVLVLLPLPTRSSTTPRWLGLAETALILVAPLVYGRMPHVISSDGYFRLETTRYLARGRERLVPSRPAAPAGSRCGPAPCASSPGVPSVPRIR